MFDNVERVLYVRLAGLRCVAARVARRLPDAVPVVVSDGRDVVDACPAALAAGVRPGAPVARARRLAPDLVVCDALEIDARPWSRRLWDACASLSACVEPVGPDAALVGLEGMVSEERLQLIAQVASLPPPSQRRAFPWAVGSSRWSARLAAESGGSFAAAPSHALWPEDTAVGARLTRLGAFTCGEVVGLGEDALSYALGARVGRILWRRALGIDTDPLRGAWPPPRVDVSRDFSVEPLEGAGVVDAWIGALAAEAAGHLGVLGRHARRVVLRIATEGGVRDATWRVPAPIGTLADLTVATNRLRARLVVDAPVVAIRLRCADLDRAPARTLALFDDDPAALGTLALGQVRALLSERYGTEALRRLGEVPQARRDRRRALRRQAEGLA